MCDIAYRRRYSHATKFRDAVYQRYKLVTWLCLICFSLQIVQQCTLNMLHEHGTLFVSTFSDYTSPTIHISLSHAFESYWFIPDTCYIDS